METRRKSQRGCIMDWETVLHVIEGLLIAAFGSGFLITRSQKKKLEADANKVDSDASKTNIDAADVLKDIVLDLIEPYRKEQQRLSDKVDKLQKKIEEQQDEINRFIGQLRKEKEERSIDRRFIREFIDRFHELRNEFFEEVGRWPVVGMPDGYEEYEE